MAAQSDGDDEQLGSMAAVPDEVWTLAFTYLHPFDLVSIRYAP